MKEKQNILDKYSLYLWAIVALLVVTIMLVPFIPGQIATIAGINIYYTPALIMSPVLMGIIFALLVSYEKQDMSPRRRCVQRVLKVSDIVIFYAYSIAIITFAATHGRINF